MRRLSIARSVQLALLALALVLAALAGLGIADLYSARQRYEDRIAAAYAVEADAAKLLAAAIVEEATQRTAAAGPTGAPDRLRARAAFLATAAEAARAAAHDPASARLVAATVTAQAGVRASNAATGAALAARAPIAALVARQAARRTAARAQARGDSRRALIEVVVAGLLALVAVLALVSALIARMRRPLEDLVAAAHALEHGDLEARVRSDGPRELRVLDAAFNAMASNLATAARQLESERRRLDETIQSLGDALVAVDPDGTVAAANPRAAELLPELGVGASVAPGSAAAEVLPPLEQALAGEVVLDRDGRTLAATAAHVGGDSAAGVVWTVRDVSERARLERLKSEFVATASHELRSPMTSIKGFVELLSGSEGLSARQREFVEIILASTNRLVDLVNDLLDVARIEAGAVEVHRRPVDLAEVIEEVTVLMRPRLDDKRQRLAVEIEPGLPRALADPARMRQVLMNLLTNAHLYTPVGGSLSIRLQHRDGMVALAIADDGPGMGPEQLERIFERFYRDRGEHSVAGTGLGLAIVKSLVDMHEGTIEVDSAVGEGSTFTVLLPPAPVRAGVSAAQAALAGRRVLVIEDERPVARLISAQLSAFGVECVIAGSGKEGIQRLRGEHFDAVTLDILMPFMSGFDVLRELRSDPALRELPIVVVSVFSGGEALAGEWVVSKPIDAEELADAIGSAYLARRVRVLAVTRPQLRAEVETTLAEASLDHVWTARADEVAMLCERHPFEAALIDAGLEDPGAAIAALELRGLRLKPAVVVFGDAPAGGLARLGAEPLMIDDAGAALAELIHNGGRGADQPLD